MKKILTILAVFAFTSSIVANAAESRIQNYVNSKIAPLTQKEQEINAKIEAQKKADAARKAELEKKQAEQRKAIEAKQAELKKQQEANKKALEKAKKDAEARKEARTKAVEAEANYWKNLFGQN